MGLYRILCDPFLIKPLMPKTFPVLWRLLGQDRDVRPTDQRFLNSAMTHAPQLQRFGEIKGIKQASSCD